MRFVLAIWMLLFAMPLYVATTKLIEFGTWQSFVLLAICAVSTWFSGMLAMKHFADQKKTQQENQQTVIPMPRVGRQAAK